MKGVFYLFVVFVCMSFPVIAGAITLDEALQEAVLYSQEARMADAEVNSAKAQANEIIAFTLPQVSVQAGHVVLGSEKKNPLDDLAGKVPEGADLSDPINRIVYEALASFSDQTIDALYDEFEIPDQQSKASAQVSQVIFSGGNVFRSWRLRRNIITQADLAKRMAISDIRKNVKIDFHKVLFQNSHLGILKDRVAQREEELNDARDLLNAGLVTSLDLRHAKLKINIASSALKEAEVSFRNALIDFNSRLGRFGDKPLLMPEGTLDRGWGLSQKIKTLQQKLSDESLLSLELVKQKKNVSVTKAKMAAGEYLPKLAVVGGVEYTNNVDIEDYTSWTAGAQMSWDLFSGGATRARRLAALASAGKADEELIKVRKEIGHMISKLTEQARVLDYRIDLQQELVSIGAENYNDARSQYRAGTITQTQMGEFHLAYTETRFGLLQLYFLERQLEVEVEALLEE